MKQQGKATGADAEEVGRGLVNWSLVRQLLFSLGNTASLLRKVTAPRAAPVALLLRGGIRELQTRMSPTNCALAPRGQADSHCWARTAPLGQQPSGPGLAQWPGTDRRLLQPAHVIGASTRPGFDGTVRTPNIDSISIQTSLVWK